MSAGQFYDDLVDRDAGMNRAQQYGFLQMVLHDIPANPFFIANRETLLPIIRKVLADWQAATDMEKAARAGRTDETMQGLAIAYEMRNGFFDIVSVVVDILSGAHRRDEFMAQWIPLTRASQSFSSYVEKVTAPDRPQKPPYETAGGDIQCEDLFATKVYRRGLSLDLDAMTDFVRELQVADTEGVERSNVKASGAWHSSELALHKEPVFEPLAKAIIASMFAIGEKHGYSPDLPFVLTAMWANVLDTGGYNRWHTHPNSLWSGVFYLKVPEGAGALVFSDPRQQALSLQAVVQDSKKVAREHSPVVDCEPHENMLVLFPGYLGHEVRPNLAAEQRISLSFNVSQRVEWR